MITELLFAQFHYTISLLLSTEIITRSKKLKKSRITVTILSDREH